MGVDMNTRVKREKRDIVRDGDGNPALGLRLGTSMLAGVRPE
jgi:hypothetical protein